MSLILAILAGLGLGYIIERGDLCFHSTLRGLFKRPRQLDLFRAYLLAILVATPIIYSLMAFQLIDPWIPPFVWQANLAGGVLFGLGMVVAATCVTGLFYKLGHGMLGTLVALVTWASGDILTYLGPLAPLREALNSRPLTAAGGQNVTLLNMFGPVVGAGLTLLLLVLIGVWLWHSPLRPRADYWRWVPLGLAVGLFTGLAWLLARAGGSTYTFGTSGVPSGLLAALSAGNSSGSGLWIPVSLASIVPGAFLAAWLSGTLWIRGETAQRYAQLAVGGLLMGIGAGIAGGCNLGHGLVGVPLLSMGSITTVIAMMIGVGLADRAIKIWAATSSKTALAEQSGKPSL